MEQVPSYCIIQGKTVKAGERAYLLEGPVFSAGSVLEWLKSKGFLSDINELETLCEQAQSPVQFLPALGGLGAPYWDYGVQASAQRISAHTTSADWVAGALQGIALRVADIVYYLRENGQPIHSPVQVSGGLVRSRYLLAFEANILQADLHVQPQLQSTALGAALLAGVKLGWPVETWRKSPVITVSPRVVPSQAQAVYQNWTQFVQSLRNR